MNNFCAMNREFSFVRRLVGGRQIVNSGKYLEKFSFRKYNNLRKFNEHVFLVLTGFDFIKTPLKESLCETCNIQEMLSLFIYNIKCIWF